MPPAYGATLQLPPIWSTTMAAVALLLVVALGVLIAQGSYTRRSTVTGQVQPSQGLIRLGPDLPGLISEVHVREGQDVQRGALLFVLSGDRPGPDSESYQRSIAAQVEARQRSLQADLERLTVVERQDEQQLRRRIGSLQSELARLRLQADQQRAQVRTAQDALTRYETLARQGYATRDVVQQRQTELAQQRTLQSGLQREVLALERELSTLEQELSGLATRFEIQRSELDRAILQTRQEATELQARRRIVIAAPADGRVTLLRAEPGQRIEPGRPLAHLVPAGSPLVARLYVPSRAAGFVRVGDEVMLRYDPFPYQKFGQQAGRVLSVSTATARPAELEQTAVPAELVDESVYAVTVALPASGLSNTGQALRLQTGMRVEADLLHESRRLYEWMLEPLFAARNRL